MTDPIIKCPKCSHEIKLTESLAAPMLEDARKAFAKQLDEARASVKAEATAKAREAFTADLALKAQEAQELKASLVEQSRKLQDAQKAQADFIKRQRELDDRSRELDLTIEKRVSDSLVDVQMKARKEAEDSLKLKVMEKEQTITSMQTQIEELRRKAEQGSQQLQGEVQELQIEATLKTRYTTDTILPVPKGEFGGDTLQHVYNSAGLCGVILWESKRTKSWSDGWLPKLRDDQRAAKADLAILVTSALPKGSPPLQYLDGVWVTGLDHIVLVAEALRFALIEGAMARKSQEGRHTKTEMLYDYLTGSRFRQRVEAIVESFSAMQEDLDKERKAIMKQWAKRQEQIERVMSSTVGMYGDIQGIAGSSVQEIKGLDLKLLEV